MLTPFGDMTLPVSRVRSEMERLLADVMDGVGASPLYQWLGRGSFPALNIWEDERSLYAEAELPGLKMEDLEVLVCGNELTIKGERRNPRQDEDTYHRQERGVGSFSRTVRLPVDIDAGKVEAALKDGILTVTLPKAETAKLRKITVKGG